MTAGIDQLPDPPKEPVTPPAAEPKVKRKKLPTGPVPLVIGAKVRVIGNNGGYHYAPVGATGIIRGDGGPGKGYAVEITDPPNWRGGHGCAGYVESRYGQWIQPKDLDPLPWQEQDGEIGAEIVTKKLAARKRKVHPRHPVTVTFTIRGMSVGSMEYMMAISTSDPPDHVVRMGAIGDFSLEKAIEFARQWKENGGHELVDTAGHRRALFAKYGKHLLTTLLLVKRLSRMKGRLKLEADKFTDKAHAAEMNIYYGSKGGG